MHTVVVRIVRLICDCSSKTKQKSGRCVESGGFRAFWTGVAGGVISVGPAQY